MKHETSNTVSKGLCCGQPSVECKLCAGKQNTHQHLQRLRNVTHLDPPLGPAISVDTAASAKVHDPARTKIAIQVSKKNVCGSLQ